MTPYAIRPYLGTDRDAWLRCRLLSFFGTEYYDDVVVERPVLEPPALALVADQDGSVIGLMDVAVEGDAATIEVVAVHPVHARRGVATALLDGVLPWLHDQGVRTLDAWTRGDEAANGWYRARGFTENHRYLHVYKEWDDPDDGFTSPAGLSAPVRAFCHAPIELKDALTARFRRVHECRQYLRHL
jgi:ribosomal protein S18 acetylase RimI-like enzyme